MNKEKKLEMLKNAIVAIHDNCVKTKERSLLDTMISTCKEIGYSDDAIGELIYLAQIMGLCDLIENPEGDEE